MTREELLTLRAILGDFRKGLVELDYVEAHIMVLVEAAVEECNEMAGDGLKARGLGPQENGESP